VPIDLGPEQQSGGEAGFDMTLGRTFTLRATGFDQTASGLIQRSTLSSDAPGGRPGGGRVPVFLQNVGEITNRGWEFQATIARGPLAIASALSLVDSRVRRLADDYAGDLRPGDRILGVPARTMSLTAAWTAAGWSATVSAQRAASWIDYDRIGLARASTSSNGSLEPLTGLELRSYWREYQGNTHLRAAFTRDIGHGLVLSLSADNLLNHQVGEPDNITVLPGRTISLGLRASF
jgi:iron complex outermembrane receptor protein